MQTSRRNHEKMKKHHANSWNNHETIMNKSWNHLAKITKRIMNQLWNKHEQLWKKHETIRNKSWTNHDTIRKHMQQSWTNHETYEKVMKQWWKNMTKWQHWLEKNALDWNITFLGSVFNDFSRAAMAILILLKSGLNNKTHEGFWSEKNKTSQQKINTIFLIAA